jgi:hypothetical protein
MEQYGCNVGVTQVQRRYNAFNRLSLLVPRPTCPTMQSRSRTATGAYTTALQSPISASF